MSIHLQQKPLINLLSMINKRLNIHITKSQVMSINTNKPAHITIYNAEREPSFNSRNSYMNNILWKLITVLTAKTFLKNNSIIFLLKPLFFIWTLFEGFFNWSFHLIFVWKNPFFHPNFESYWTSIPSELEFMWIENSICDLIWALIYYDITVNFHGKTFENIAKKHLVYEI